MHSLWYGYWWLGLGLVDGLVWPTSLDKLTHLGFLLSATNASHHQLWLQHHLLMPFIIEITTHSPQHRRIQLKIYSFIINLIGPSIFCNIHGGI
jgi:hypothetical protein